MHQLYDYTKISFIIGNFSWVQVFVKSSTAVATNTQNIILEQNQTYFSIQSLKQVRFKIIAIIIK